MSNKYVGLRLKILSQENDKINEKLKKFIGKEKRIILHNIISENIENGQIKKQVIIFLLLTELLNLIIYA